MDARSSGPAQRRARRTNINRSRVRRDHWSGRRTSRGSQRRSLVRRRCTRFRPSGCLCEIGGDLVVVLLQRRQAGHRRTMDRLRIGEVASTELGRLVGEMTADGIDARVVGGVVGDHVLDPAGVTTRSKGITSAPASATACCPSARSSPLPHAASASEAATTVAIVRSALVDGIGRPRAPYVQETRREVLTLTFRGRCTCRT